MQLITLLLPLLTFTPFAFSNPTPVVALPSFEIESRTITGYAVRKFRRDCTNVHLCAYVFTIDTGEEQQVCTIIDETPVLDGKKGKRTGPPATTHAWYGKPCIQNSNWVISWGWDYQGDFTVLTVVHQPNRRAAYFGYKSPNTGLPVVNYPDVGPNRVETLSP